MWVPAAEAEPAAEALRRAAARLQEAGLAVDPAAVRTAPAKPEAEWRDAWKRWFKVARVGKRIVIVPSWERHQARPEEVVLDLDPGRAFGTGAHPTTRLCLELLAELRRGSLVDVGCGSGVIAIAAAKLGFAPVTAVDVDPQAVQVTRQNAVVNGVELTAVARDARTGGLPETDVAVANIALDSVEELGGVLRARHAVTSGYLVSEQPMLDGYRILERHERDGWAADLYERR